MKTLQIALRSFLVIVLLNAFAAHAQNNNSTNSAKTENAREMKTYVIERELPGAGKLTPEQLKKIAQTSCGVLKEMGSQIEWLHSYVVENKIYCVYRAENKELVYEHAKKGGFPANSVSEVAEIISPATAE